MLVLGLLNEKTPFRIEEKPGCGAGGASSGTGWSESTQVLLRQDQSINHVDLFTEPLDISRSPKEVYITRLWRNATCPHLGHCNFRLVVDLDNSSKMSLQ